MTNDESRELLSPGEALIRALPGERFGAITDTELAVVAADPATRSVMVIIRCRRGRGRCVCPAEHAPGVVAEIERNGDYVRDVSIAPSELEKRGMGTNLEQIAGRVFKAAHRPPSDPRTLDDDLDAAEAAFVDIDIQEWRRLNPGFKDWPVEVRVERFYEWMEERYPQA